MLAQRNGKKWVESVASRLEKAKAGDPRFVLRNGDQAHKGSATRPFLRCVWTGRPAACLPDGM